MITKETLEAALQIVQSAWTDKGKAVNAKGDVVLPWAEDAVAWNSSGAIYKAVGNDLGTVRPIMALQKEFEIDISDVDKVYGKTEIVSAYKRAIVSEESSAA